MNTEQEILLGAYLTFNVVTLLHESWLVMTGFMIQLFTLYLNCILREENLGTINSSHFQE